MIHSYPTIRYNMLPCSYLTAVSWYFIFGILHELSHALIALLFIESNQINSWWEDINWRNLLLYRKFELNLSLLHEINGPKRVVFVIRHFGWIASVSIAFLVLHLVSSRRIREDSSDGSRKNSNLFKWCQVAAYVTAMDAVCTDLLQINPFSIDSISPTYSDELESTKKSTITFFCGNFGVILLHSAWLYEDGGQTTLDILRKMIEVTMMRGAQSGGIVTFEQKNAKADNDHGNGIVEMKSTRSRVVKSKRGDLSQILTKKIAKDAFPSFFKKLFLKNKTNDDDIGSTRRHVSAIQEPNSSLRRNVDARFFAGHTRFATSSKADLDGTHPHQWTPPTFRRIFDTDNAGSNPSPPENIPTHNFDLSGRRYRRVFVRDSPKKILVENYITHNGDFEYFELNGNQYDIDVIQQFLVIATGSKMPAVVDSAAIAGMVDLIRCKGSFALSCRYVVCLGLPTSEIVTTEDWLPSEKHYHKMESLFEEALADFQKVYPVNLKTICEDESYRESLILKATEKIVHDNNKSLLEAFTHHFKHNGDEEDAGVSVYQFAKATVNAFFDNDLFNTVKIFLKHASGSFGLCVMSSLDAHRQMCLAARGQSISIAFYPQKKMICYGSEQAAVKAGMLYKFPGSSTEELTQTILNVEGDAQRLDLDDVGGEICLIDWYKASCPVSLPNRDIEPKTMMFDKVSLYLYQESSSMMQPKLLHHRMTKLNKNPLILPLKEDAKDTIAQDLQDIPKVCRALQHDWRNVDNKAMFSLNRLTAVNLGKCIKEKLNGYASGSIHRQGKVDILLTGCEVSLWLAEQFASDMKKCFPNLAIQCISSNKLLGLFGQEDMSVPTVGFPFTEKTLQFEDTIMLIVSHSGGTFGPLACSSLFQSITKNIFVVTSEWDTQIGKQLRSMNHNHGSGLWVNSHIFTTGVGIRPAEPCSISVVATHQLLTNIFQYISILILSNDEHKQVTGAIVDEKDLQVLEKCNRDNIYALEQLVGADNIGGSFESHKEVELRKSGDIWAEHVLENVKAYIMSFLYIFGTVISGYPLVSGIAYAAGLDSNSNLKYLTRMFDAIIYFFLPQINVIILRLIQKRPLRHRMVGRTVVIGDVPWVAQAAEAFLSKIFACSYSIAGINVHSANPADHLVHRMTHRVVRGSLLICGRPDGRLSALTAAENAVSLSINQASSIQSIGSTCETVTIGHNEFKLPLSARGIFLDRNRPLFLCEYLLADKDGDDIKAQNSLSMSVSISHHSLSHHSITLSRHGLANHSITQSLQSILNSSTYGPVLNANAHQREIILDDNDDTLLQSIKSTKYSFSKKRRPNLPRSSAALLGQYKTMQKEHSSSNLLDFQSVSGNENVDNEMHSMRSILEKSIQEKKWQTQAHRLFVELNTQKDAKLKHDEFINGLKEFGCDIPEEELSKLFLRFDYEGKGYIFFDDFFTLMSMHKIDVERVLKPCIRDARGLIQVGPCQERFFGESLIQSDDKDDKIRVSLGAMRNQHLSQELYESRIASMQRFVAMTVLFHQMGSRVSGFFSKISFGLLGYRMDRSHSIMRIATTASPISGAEIRERADALHYGRKVNDALDVIANAWLTYDAKKKKRKQM